MKADDGIHLQIKKLQKPVPWCQTWVDDKGKTHVLTEMLSLDGAFEFAELDQLPSGRSWCEACLVAYERIHGSKAKL